MKAKDKIVAVLVAAGTGSRSGSDVPKQFRIIGGKAVLAHAAQALLASGRIDALHVVIGADQEAMARDVLRDLPVASFVTGADSRRGSVRAGLEAVAALGGADIVLIHDAARPFLPAEVIDRLIDALGNKAGAIPVLPVIDSIVRGTDATMGATVDRAGLHRVQTPQAFRFDAIVEAHRRWDITAEATDDAQILAATGEAVALVAGDERLEKLTYPEDFSRAQTRLSPQRVTRVGMGYDVHRLAKGEQLWLGGVEIAHDFGLAGHSDADVALHAIVDAILGAIADGDIGSHFPPSDEKWRGASSDRFLAYAVDRVAARGGVIDHVDLTIICEAPKIGPYRDAMRARIADIAGVTVEQVSVKATTTERLGFAGRREGIAAQAVATISLPALS